MRKNTGFTLVELVVVVMILGILAAVAAPKLLGTSSRATDNGAKQTLAVVRDAIERFAAEHGGALPGADGNQATLKTDLTDYLRGVFPKCEAYLDNSSVDVDPVNEDIVGLDDGTNSWRYNNKTGKFIINSHLGTKSAPTVRYDEL
jgi:prepilin-type N-terminal cleavage/methylation domain-containing protein